jgi:hypothetical protein
MKHRILYKLWSWNTMKETLYEYTYVAGFEPAVPRSEAHTPGTKISDK